VTNGIPLGCPLFLPVGTVNCVLQTLKVPANLNFMYGDDSTIAIGGGGLGHAIELNADMSDVRC
jgi:hypothetical protein